MTSSAPPPVTSPFMFSKGPVFGNPSSRPKSPKGTVIENPFLKNPQLAYNGRATIDSMTHQQHYSHQNPSMPLGATTNISQQPLSSDLKPPIMKVSGPPPKTSLSLMEGIVVPIQVDTSTTEKKQTVSTSFVRTPTTVASPLSSPLTSISAPRANTANNEGLLGIDISAPDENWIVGFGFAPTSVGQCQELLDILSSCGTIEQQLSGGNWVAVQFASRYSAEKAILCQPIYSSSSNVYFGISRLTFERLQILQQQKSKAALSGDWQASMTIDEERHNTNGIKLNYADKLDEKDILLLTNAGVQAGKPAHRSKPESICEKLLAWYFEWEYETPAHHPHSD